MTFRATASILLAASLGALATACASNARPFAPVAPSRSCNFAGEVRGSLTFWRFADTTAIRGTAGEALDTAAAVLRREGYTVARRAAGTTVVTWAAPVGLQWPLAVRVQGAGAQQVAFCALWGGRNAGLLADQPGFSPSRRAWRRERCTRGSGTRSSRAADAPALPMRKPPATGAGISGRTA